MKNWNDWIGEKLLYYLSPFFALLTLPVVIYLAIYSPSNELQQMLQTSAQLNVTVAIGIGTLEIAIKAPDKKRAGVN